MPQWCFIRKTTTALTMTKAEPSIYPNLLTRLLSRKSLGSMDQGTESRTQSLGSRSSQKWARILSRDS